MLTQSVSPVAIRRPKIEHPLLSGQWVRRPRIEACLDRALTRSLTVVTAPAGHGKTSTIVSWLRLRDIDAAWVTVDRRDADLTRFAVHVAAALDRVAPGIAERPFALLTVPDRLAPRELGEAFGEELYELEQDLVLVLDDVHAAGEGAVIPFLDGLLRSVPRRLHTILSSRAKPAISLSRLRIAGDVEELTGADLRFSPQETAELLHREMGEEVTPDLAASIHASIGGWPAAVRLIASGRASHDGPNAIAEPRERDEQLLIDYLGEEVLTRLPPAERDLLLRASLVERFNASLLEALSAVQGGERVGRTQLERLRALELYREIPGLSETWYAYHPLFRSVLRGELERVLDAGAIGELQRGAAQWFAEAGLSQEALQLFVEAGDLSAAASLIESRLIDAFAREDWHSVAAWLRLMPMDQLQRSPELLLASAWVAYLSGRGARIAEVLETMRDPGFRHAVTPAHQAEITLIADSASTGPLAWIEVAERAITLLPPTKRYRLGYAHVALGMALASAGREDEALARLSAFTERESSHIDAASIRGYFGRILVLWQTGRLTPCGRVAADQLQLAQTNGLVVSAGWGTAFLGFVAHERGDLNQATRHFEAVIAGAAQFHLDCVRESFFAQILAYEAQGMRSEADRAISRLREIALASETLHQLELVDAFAARTALIRGDLAAAQRWVSASSPTIYQSDLKCIEHPFLTRAKILIAQNAADAMREADRILAEFLAHARATHMTLALIEGLAVQALLHEAHGNRAAATAVLRTSLEMAAPEGIVQRYAYLGPALAPILRRLLAERAPMAHARHALDALKSVLAAQPASMDTHENLQRVHPETPLTERETQVLRRLSLRLTNNEIGDELFISPITVKHHIANLSGKLGVSGRRAAVARAIDLGFLDE